MDCYRIRLKLESPVGTPWHSDTLFGHLCWQVAYGSLDMEISEFLKPFKNGKPPFVLSDGFPEGCLPLPLVDLELPEASTVGEYSRFKVWKKARYVTFNDFVRICRKEQPIDKPLPHPWVSVMTPHASMDRATFTVSDDGGFFETQTDYPNMFDHIDVYVRAEDNWIDRIVTLLESLSQVGYGRDRTTGLGAFSLEGTEEITDFDSVNAANGAVSLSSMIPAENDPIEVRFRLRTKYGKLGEGLFENPFKKPLLQMEPGAVLECEDGFRPFYGSLIENIAPGRPEAVQNCYGLVVPCRI